MPRIVEAHLIPWEPGIPGVSFRYFDGIEACSDARVRSRDVIEAIGQLTAAERQQLEAALAS